MSVANNLCDKWLPKYLDSKTGLIYCPHPVYIIHLLCTVKSAPAIIAVLAALTAVYDQLMEPQSGVESVSSGGLKMLSI